MVPGAAGAHSGGAYVAGARRERTTAAAGVAVVGVRNERHPPALGFRGANARVGTF